MTTVTNTALATALATAPRGRFTGIIQRLVGTEKGGVRYADALVHDVVVTGFSYTRLKARDLARLQALTLADLEALASEGHEAWDRPRAKTAAKVPVTLAHLQAALAAMIDSAQKSIAGTNTSTTDDVFEPLVVDGQTVPGARVYVGSSDPSKPPASKPGTIYLQGLRVGRKVLDQPQNGWAPQGKSGVEATAKELIGKFACLPSRRYVSYRLDPDSGFVLALGGLAAVAADKAGVSCDPVLVDEVKIALVG